jgi:hypothetical protein
MKTAFATNLNSLDALIRKLLITTWMQRTKMVLVPTQFQVAHWYQHATTILLQLKTMAHVNSHLAWDAWMELLVILMEKLSTMTNQHANSQRSITIAKATA